MPDAPCRLYGLTQCDQVRKAKRWLQAEQIDFEMIDFKRQRFQPAHIRHWLEILGPDAVINPASKAFKALSEQEKNALLKQPLTELAHTLHATPTLLKRPILETAHGIVLRFQPDAFSALLAQSGAQTENA